MISSHINHLLISEVTSISDVDVMVKLPKNEQEIIKGLVHTHITTKEKLINGIAASYYGVSNVGAALHRSKYETKEDFPDFLLRSIRLCDVVKYGHLLHDSEDE